VCAAEKQTIYGNTLNIRVAGGNSKDPDSAGPVTSDHQQRKVLRSAQKSSALQAKAEWQFFIR
jgi:hypothetical protein